MNQAQFYCRSIKRLCNSSPLLPVEYQQVEYLENSGEEYITTFIRPYQTLITELRFSLSANPDYTKMWLFGTRGTSGSFWSTNYFAELLSATRLYVPNGLYETNVDITLASGENTLYYTSGEIALNGSVISDKTTAYHYQTNRGINLWSRPSYYINGNPSSIEIASAGLRIHEVRFTYDGNLVGYMHPCYRKSDNKPGMYDLVTNTFFTNAGTGEFTVGNNI